MRGLHGASRILNLKRQPELTEHFVKPWETLSPGPFLLAASHQDSCSPSKPVPNPIMSWDEASRVTDGPEGASGCPVASPSGADLLCCCSFQGFSSGRDFGNSREGPGLHTPLCSFIPPVRPMEASSPCPVLPAFLSRALFPQAVTTAFLKRCPCAPPPRLGLTFLSQ